MSEEKDAKLLLLSRLYDDILNDQDIDKVYKYLVKIDPQIKKELLEKVEELVVKEAVKLEKEGFPIENIMSVTHQNITGENYGRK